MRLCIVISVIVGILTSCTARNVHTKQDKIVESDVNGYESPDLLNAEEHVVEIGRVIHDEEKMGQDFGQYQIQSDDTLMKISFKIYGTVFRWKELRDLNVDVFAGKTHIIEGAYIKFRYPKKRFSWDVLGDPYLILSGDTLGKISYKKYRTHQFWREIYQNNRHLIRDPDMIYAGFTIYTTQTPEKMRAIASQKESEKP